ncbi:MAG: hypothetical protein PHE51_08970 [Eubacteriales bacterium]|nr:hypothetical protein [Eubacteriales bacterium]
MRFIVYRKILNADSLSSLRQPQPPLVAREFLVTGAAAVLH